MKMNMCFLYLMLFLIFINLTTPRHFDITSKGFSEQNNEIPSNSKGRKLENNDDYKPIRILFDVYYLEKLEDANFARGLYYGIFERCKNMVAQLINVKPLENPIKLDFSKYPNFEENIVNGTLKTGNNNYDLIIITKINLQAINEINSTSILRDPNTNRTILALIEFENKGNAVDNYFHYFEYLLLHHIIHILGFSYESFEYFPGGKEKVYITEKDIYGLDRNYIKSPKVIEFAKMYYGCDSISKLPLENQHENKTITHWEAQKFLGEIMSSYGYTGDLVLSEFTLALLEDSGWYKVNYYTGGLMRFGKHKGCEFLDEDCSDKFKNEYFNYIEGNSKPSCSSGRQSRTYRVQTQIEFSPQNNKYNRYNKQYLGPLMLEYCIVSDTDSTEMGNNYFPGNCKLGDDNYGRYVPFPEPFEQRNEVTSYLNISFSNNSYCILASFKHINTPYNLTGYIFPICYEMFCNNFSLTIKIGRQYIVCPRNGGKVEINGDYEGHIYCPDFNLICTGTEMCNDIFDCINKKSQFKNSTFSYDYNISTNQHMEEFDKEENFSGFELSEGGKCPINCSQCYEGGECIECRNSFYLIGTTINEKNTKCLANLNVSSGYFKYNNVYYPCLDNCDTCSNQTLCEKCKKGYYFIGNNRAFCDSGKDVDKYYFTLDNGISYFPCDTNFNLCEQCENQANSCFKCKSPYYFINEKNECVSGKDLTGYFTEDEGILWLLCRKYITNCSDCSSKNQCIRCDYPEYYFIKDDRTNCVTGKNLEEYYTEDGGVSYYPCETNFPNCLKCSGPYTCNTCKDNYIFLRGEKKECFTNEKDKTYIENGLYYPCNDSLPFCDKCSSKTSCYDCLSDYYLVRNSNNKLECLKIDIAKYYQLPDLSYRLCSEAITNCDECSNSTICTKCKNGYYFLEKNYNQCRNDLDLKKYYSEDNGISYYPCGYMHECNYCSKKDICEECNANFYLYKEIKNECVQLDDLEKYYKNGSSYYPCNQSIQDCNKCFDSQGCYECLNGKKIIYKEQNKCYEDGLLKDNNSYYKINDTFYGKCSNDFPNCDVCYNNSMCVLCQKDHYFINDNYKDCINIDNIKPEREYYKLDNLNYYTCSYKGVNNCKECRDNNTCYACNEDHALLSWNYSFCHPKTELEKGFYHDENGIMYFPCIDKCDICTNGTECINCRESDNYLPFNYNKVCDTCKVNINYINEEFSYDLFKKYTNNYINENMNIFSNVSVYLNEENNFIIIIFRAWYCTNSLFEDDYFEINAEELVKNLSYNLNTSEHFVISYVNYKYNNYLEVYDIEKNESIDINKNCPDCLSHNILKIKNKFKKILNSTLGGLIQNKINDFNIKLFDKDDPIFNDICLNFTLDNVDLTLRERREFVYLGYMEKEILCHDISCNIENYSLYNLSSNCNCKIQTDINDLNKNETTNSITKEEYEDYLQSKTSVNSFLIFKCAKETFSSKILKYNANLYISCAFIAIQIILFGFYAGFHKSKKTTNQKSSKKKEILKPSPPKIEKFSVSDELEEENYSKFENGKADLIKITQEKDKQILYNSIESEDEDVGDPEKNIQDKDIDSVREREIENEIINSGGEVTEETMTIKMNHFRGKRALKNNKYSKEIIYSESGQDDLSSKKKYKFKFEDDFPGDKVLNSNNYPLRDNNKKSRNKNNYSTERNSLQNESFSLSELKNIENDIIQKTEYISFTQAIKNPSVSFWEYYFKLIQLKQPIINLFSPIKCLKIEESYIPTLVKLMRIVFIFSLNMFFNALHLNQKYFRDKYNHFNKKYNIRYAFLDKNISLSEQFRYGLGHAVLSGFISFLICLIIQSIFNYFLFNIKKKLTEIENIEKVDLKDSNQKKNSKNGKTNQKDILLLMKKAKKNYIIFFSVCFAIMLIIFYSVINFAQVYVGGVLDFVAGIFWAFIFLQIIPFIYCLIFSFCRYKGIKNNNEKLYKLGQSIFF